MAEQDKQKQPAGEILVFPGAEVETEAERMERKQAEQMGREILKAAREADLSPEEAQEAIGKALQEARERKAEEDARKLELAREVQRKRAEQLLGGKSVEAYLKESQAKIAKLQKEIVQMEDRAAFDKSEYKSKMIAEAERELVFMQQKQLMVEQLAKGEKAQFVNLDATAVGTTERPEVMPSEKEMAEATADTSGVTGEYICLNLLQ